MKIAGTQHRMIRMFKIPALLIPLLFVFSPCFAIESPESSKSKPKNLIASLNEDAQGITAVCFSPDGKTIAAAGRDGLIRIWRMDKKKIWKILGEHTGWVKCLAFSPDGKHLASGGSDKNIVLWDTALWKPAHSLMGHDRGVNAVEFSPDSKILASGSDDQTVRIWDPELGKKIKTLGKHKDSVRGLSFYPDGKFLVSGGSDFKIKVWDAVKWKEAAVIEGIPNEVESVAFSNDGKIIAGCWEGTIGIWTAGTGKRANTLRFNTHFKSISFFPGSSILAAGGTDKMIHIVNGETGAELRKLEGHSESVEAVHFSPAGRFLVSGGLDSSVKIWEALRVYVRNAETPLKNSAGETLITLKEGAEVQIERAKGSQFYVRVRDHLKGWVSEGEVSFEKLDLRRPIARIAGITVFGASVTIRGAAYDDVKITSVFVEDQFFTRKEASLAQGNFGDVFNFEETVPLRPWGKPILKVIDEAGREFSVQFSTSDTPPDFTPRYGSLLVQRLTKAHRRPSLDSTALETLSPGTILNSIGFQGEWYLLEEGGWVSWLNVVDQLTEIDEEPK